MTQPNVGPTVAAPNLSSAMDALRAAGLRLSATRRLMLEALYAGDQPLTAEQLATKIGGASPEVASVYRNLEVLEQAGLVRHFHLGHSPGLYVHAGAGAREYLVCGSCQAVKSVAPNELDAIRDEVRRGFGWEARFTHSPIVGLCPDCSSRAPRAHLEIATDKSEATKKGPSDASA